MPGPKMFDKKYEDTAQTVLEEIRMAASNERGEVLNKLKEHKLVTQGDLERCRRQFDHITNAQDLQAAIANLDDTAKEQYLLAGRLAHLAEVENMADSTIGGLSLGSETDRISATNDVFRIIDLLKGNNDRLNRGQTTNAEKAMAERLSRSADALPFAEMVHPKPK
ncbi:MAG: hypothetical protein A3F18_08125 [Legionellales bacterium RIFCSPHIGHO2_12_FULL_37_14]|nr:MAG: hypothetical protein A3F18_08125 [Legionellales bacterium RIFCSPHIGHO2_12_FULL_37_14]